MEMEKANSAFESANSGKRRWARGAGQTQTHVTLAAIAYVYNMQTNSDAFIRVGSARLPYAIRFCIHTLHIEMHHSLCYYEEGQIAYDGRRGRVRVCRADASWVDKKRRRDDLPLHCLRWKMHLFYADVVLVGVSQRFFSVLSAIRLLIYFIVTIFALWCCNRSQSKRETMQKTCKFICVVCRALWIYYLIMVARKNTNAIAYLK